MRIEASASRIIQLSLLIALAVFGTLHPSLRSSAQPTIPMVVQGTAYVDGAAADDGTVVEARIGGETVDSTTTETVDEQQGRCWLAFEGESGEPVGFSVGGEEALAFGEAGLVDRVPFDYGVHDYVLFVGEFPLERVYLPVIVGDTVIGRNLNPLPLSPDRMGIGALVWQPTPHRHIGWRCFTQRLSRSWNA